MPALAGCGVRDERLTLRVHRERDAVGVTVDQIGRVRSGRERRCDEGEGEDEQAFPLSAPCPGSLTPETRDELK